MLFSQELEELIDAVLQDGTITPKERATLHKRAAAEGADPDEVDIVIEARLNRLKKQSRIAAVAATPTAPPPPPPAAPEATPTASTAQKYGTVLKCPNCGTRIRGGTAVCPTCNYTFHGISANASIERLNAKLEAFNRENKIAESSGLGKQLGWGCLSLCFWPIAVPVLLLKGGNKPIFRRKADIISTFAVPNTRADLLDFLSMVQQRANATAPKNGTSSILSNEDMGYAYWLLYCNCINKARINFADDPSFASFFDFHNREMRRSKGILALISRNTKLFLFILWMVVFFCWMYFDENRGNKKSVEKETKYEYENENINENETRDYYYEDEYVDADDYDTRSH
ncbi:MAG: hypothetical protein KBT12_03040 [Bacteroidales bacterium]|nr:hypothetical protein [Candidatus Physcousia equi]